MTFIPFNPTVPVLVDGRNGVAVGVAEFGAGSGALWLVALPDGELWTGPVAASASARED